MRFAARTALGSRSWRTAPQEPFVATSLGKCGDARAADYVIEWFDAQNRTKWETYNVSTLIENAEIILDLGEEEEVLVIRDACNRDTSVREFLAEALENRPADVRASIFGSSVPGPSPLTETPQRKWWQFWK